MPHTTRRWLFTFVAVAALAGCQSPPQPEELTLINPFDARQMGYNVTWQTDTDLPADYTIKHIELLGDLLTLSEEPRNTITAVHTRDGSLAWVRAVGQPLEVVFAPVRKGDHVYVNTDAAMYKINADSGEILGAGDLEHVVLASPVLYQDYAIFGAANGRVFAHDIRSNFSKWQYDLTTRITARGVLVANTVFLADTAGVYVLLFADTGEVIWRKRAFDSVVAQPAANHQTVFVPSRDSTLYAIHRDTGRDSWRFHATEPLTQSPIVLGRYVFQPLNSGQLVALDITDGKELWRLDSAARPVMLRGAELLVLDKRALHVLNLRDGETIESFKTMPLRDVLTTEEGTLFLIAEDGRIARLDPRS